MKLKSYKYFYCLLIILLFFSPLNGEEEIDIWKNKNKKQVTEKNEPANDTSIQKLNKDSIKSIELNQNIKIEDNLSKNEESKVFGIYDPAENDFNLNMWSSTKADELKASLKRLEKINLSRTSNEILERILFSFSFAPQNMSEEEFTNLRIRWLIKNKRYDLIESFLKQNDDFKSKDKAIQYLVDENIAKADIKKGCEKIKFIEAILPTHIWRNLKFIV